MGVHLHSLAFVMVVYTFAASSPFVCVSVGVPVSYSSLYTSIHVSAVFHFNASAIAFKQKGDVNNLMSAVWGGGH